MKNITNLISIIFLIIIFNNCSAQHVQDPSADKFAGTWKWGDTTNGVTFIMKKENNIRIFGQNESAVLDAIIGFHKIYKNGILSEDKTMFSNTNFEDKKKSFIAGTAIHEPNPNKLFVNMTHKNKNIQLTILYIDSTHIKITEVRNMEGARFIRPGDAPIDWSIDIPNNIVLTKQ